MKVAFLFFGVSKVVYQHARLGMKKVDYRKSLDNYKQFLWKYFEQKGAEIDTYLSTYKHDSIPELLNDFKPKKYRVIDWMQNARIGRNTHVKNVLECCMEGEPEYDYVVLTRFDLLFKIPFKDEMFNFDTINAVSILEHDSLICDNFYMFPFRLLPLFYDAAFKTIPLARNHHELKGVLDKALKDNKLCPMHYILNERKSVPRLSFYKIVRTNVQIEK